MDPDGLAAVITEAAPDNVASRAPADFEGRPSVRPGGRKSKESGKREGMVRRVCWTKPVWLFYLSNQLPATPRFLWLR